MGGKISKHGSYNLEKKEKEINKLNRKTTSVLSLTLSQIYEDELETPERDSTRTGIDKRRYEIESPVLVKAEKSESHTNTNIEDKQTSDEVTIGDDSILEEERWKEVLNQGYWSNQGNNEDILKMEQVEVDQRLDDAGARDGSEQVEVIDYNSSDNIILLRKEGDEKEESEQIEVVDKTDDKSYVRLDSCEAQVEVVEMHSEVNRNKVDNTQEEIQIKSTYLGISQLNNGEIRSKDVAKKIVKEDTLEVPDVKSNGDSEDLEFYDAEDFQTYEQVEVINNTTPTNILIKSDLSMHAKTPNNIDTLNNHSFEIQHDGELTKNVEEKLKTTIIEPEELPNEIINPNPEISNFETAVTTVKETNKLEEIESNKNNVKQAMNNSDKLLIDISLVKTEIIDYKAPDNVQLWFDHEDYNTKNNKIEVVYDIPLNGINHIKDGCNQPDITEIKNDTQTNISDIDIINNLNNNFLHNLTLTNLKTSLHLPLSNTSNIGDFNRFSETFTISSYDPCYESFKNYTTKVYEEKAKYQNLQSESSSNLTDENEKESLETFVIEPMLTPEEIAKDQMKLWVEDEQLNEEIILKINSIISRVNQVKYEIDNLDSLENDKDVRTSMYQTLIKLMRDVNNISTNNYNEKVIQLQHTALNQVHNCLKQLEVKNI